MSHSVPEFPADLPGELWGVTCFYNPAGYKNKLSNLRIMSEAARVQGLKLMIVELAFEDSAFEVPESLCDQLVQRRTESVLWQKERLLNIGLQHLNPRCDKVVWLDADVIFENDQWVTETDRLLRSYVVVQPFDTACWLPKGMMSGPPQSFFGFGNREGQSLPGMGYTMSKTDDKQKALSSYFSHGHTGFAWAARRALLDKHGLYDCQVLGNGDFVMGHAMYGNDDFWNGRNWECSRLSPQLLSHIVEWSREFYRDVQGSVVYVPGRALHLWHGNQTDRMYDDRLLVLKECDFDPRTDLCLDENECWIWNSDKPILHQWAAEYFHSRREE
jgi:hypothetical protein